MKRTLLIGAGLGAAALILSACGGGASAATAPTAASPATSTAATTTPTPLASGSVTGQGQGNRGAAFQAFQACLTQHGVTSTQGLFGRRDQQPGGTPQARPSMDAKTQAAFTACRSLLPQGGFFQRNNAQFQAFQTCMSDHGVPLSLPTPGARPSAASGQATPGRRSAFGLDLTNAKTKAAYDTCKVLLPNNGNFRGGADDQRPSGSIAAVPSPGASTQG